MATLTRDQISQYATGAGFSGDDVDIAVAVALAESGGNTTSHNTKPPDDSYGLWQINMYGALGPSRRKTFGLKTDADLFDPVVNAKAAKSIKDGSGWNAWTTYTTGKYKQFQEPGTVDTIKLGLGEVAGVSDIAGSINALGKNIFNGIARAVGVAVAAVLLILGVIILLRHKIPVKKAVKVASKGVL